ncbi:MAG: sigma-70 family RNA polymerase sigma factor [Planctomycetales bacterium]|nr:sigma-70 family RNA polymerase sigma factor [Planctomycetales bacterium]
MSIDSESKPLTGSGQAEFAELIARHQTGVWRYLRALGADPVLADDLTQDTFLEVLRKPFQQFSDTATGSYLRRVAHNLFISRRRRDARVSLIENPEQFDLAWMRWAGFDNGNRALEALAECFERLTDRAKEALRLRFDSKASRQSIGQSLGISEHGAKNLMQRAKTQLRACVEKKLK